MIGFNKALSGRRPFQAAAAVALIAISACTSDLTTTRQFNATLSIGFGENPEAGIQQSVRNIALEGLVRIDRDGRPSPWLAERWSVSPDGLTWRLRLRPGATFHNGEPATASVVRDIIRKELPAYVGPVFDDVKRIEASGHFELEFALKRRSSFLLEGLDLPIQQAGETPVGTGPFSIATRALDDVEMQANPHYYGGPPEIDRIVFRPYESVRAAWADMLRGRVDMLYEVGIDALDSLRPSAQTKVFTFQRPYAFLVLLNVGKPRLQGRVLRQALNAAIDREALIGAALNGHGVPADGPVWPQHWAYSPQLPHFRYLPQRVNPGGDPVRFTCLLLADQSHERMSLVLQRQLRAVGVEVTFEQLPSDQFVARLNAGEFEAALGDYRMGPSLLRQHQLWHAGAPFNWGHFNSVSVNEALDRIQSAPDEAAYKVGVADLQRAIVDDPPAIFLAWGERLRAVSTRFEVHEEPGRDILGTLRLWRPVADERLISPN